MRKILIIGHGRHGKDTVAEMIADYIGTAYRGSSEICADFIFEQLKYNYGYATPKECFEDRANHRALWHNLIKEYCAADKAKLGSLIYSCGDIYCGIRDRQELDAVIAKFDPLVIWVHCNKKPLEPRTSMNITPHQDWPVIHNNGTLADLRKAVVKLVEPLYPSKWTSRFYRQAERIAEWSKDPDGQVGCLLVSPDKCELVPGYNGLPKNIADSCVRLENNELKKSLTVHAETNAIMNARRNLTGWTLYTTKPPCLSCACQIIQAGIVKVICPEPVNTSSWYNQQCQAQEILKEAKIDINLMF